MIAPKRQSSLTANQILSSSAHSVVLSAKQNQEHKKFFTNRNIRHHRNRSVFFIPPGVAERDYNTTDRRRALGLARRKMEESPMAQGIVKVQADNIVGSGFRLSMKTENDGYNKDVEMRWEEKKDQIDARGMRRWGRLQRMWWSRQFIDGDVLLIKTVKDKRGLLIQSIEADRVRKTKGDSVDTGIELDDLGMPLRYFVSSRPKNQDDTEAVNEPGKPFEADRCILYARFPGERADQARGTSGFLANFDIFEDFQECLDGMVQKVKNHAYQTINLRKDIAPDGTVLGADAEEIVKDEDGDERRHFKVKPGSFNVLDEGESVDLLESNSPNSEFVPFLRYMTRYMGISWGVPLEMILMDFSETNFAGGRALMGLAKKGFRVEQDDLAWVSSKVFKWWLANEIESNGLKVPRGTKQEFAHAWVKPKWPYLNPQQEIAAFGNAVDRGFMTHEEVIDETSEFTKDEVFAKLGKEISQKKALGIPDVFGSQGAVMNEAEAEPGTLPEDKTDPEPEDTDEAAKFATLKAKFDAYGVAVRAGSITPQIADEEAFRLEGGLPTVSAEIRSTWKDEGGVRRPITLAIPGDAIEQPIAEPEDTDTET